MKKKYWYRLDNSAMVYPMVITLGTQSLFQLGAELNSNVNSNYLKIALNTALERFPYYKVELKNGLFRHYLDENTHFPIVKKYNGNLLQIINFRPNKNYLFRLSYYENKIFLDLFHGLCDANGGIEFLKTIIFYYFQLQHIKISPDNIYTLDKSISPEEMEDAFLKYYKPFKFFEGTKKMAGGTAYKIPGKQFYFSGLGLIQGTIPTQKLLDLAHLYNCTLTVFVSALLLYSVAKTNKNTKNKENFVAFIPINLRKFYPSVTMSNFTIFAKCVVPYNTPLELANFIEIIKDNMRNQLKEDELSIKLSYTSLFDKLVFLRFMPLIFKGFISRVGRNFPGKSKQTMIISNIGRVKIDLEGDNINKFNFALNTNHKSPKNIGIVSYKDKTIISFSRKVVNTEVEKEFFRTLANFGLDVSISSNLREECNVL